MTSDRKTPPIFSFKISDSIEKGISMGSSFLADSMLGRLAKWLRVMGYDTHYQPFYGEGFIEQRVNEGRRLLSRHRGSIEHYSNSVFISSDHVKDQLHEMKSRGNIAPERSNWFTRCLICNVPLQTAEARAARENVPEYVFYQNTSDIRFCPSCGRYFWPGTHGGKMIRQLEEWGF